MTDEIVPLARAGDEASFGGKAVQLGIAARGGLPVPSGFALNWRTVDRLASGEAGDEPALASVLRQLGSPVAVRSSAVGEDSAGASFAGQHLTRLGVRSTAALVDAVRATWQSGRSDGALAYRRKLGLDPEPRVAVVVQRMVEADCAGVMFTRDPMTGADVRVIEAAWGLGESVVSGLIDPDRYTVNRGGVVAAAAIGDKHVAVRIASDGTTSEEPVDVMLRQSRCLDDGQLRLLDDLATRCDAVFGPTPHDIEWAFEAGQLYLLQRRLITSLKLGKSEA